MKACYTLVRCVCSGSDRWWAPHPSGRQSLRMRARVNHPLSCDGSCQWRAHHMAWHQSRYVTLPARDATPPRCSPEKDNAYRITDNRACLFLSLRKHEDDVDVRAFTRW